MKCKGQECERDAERDGYCRGCWASHQANLRPKGTNWRKYYVEAIDKIEAELGPVTTCQKCRQKPCEMEAPGYWCRFCWSAWWADGMVDDKQAKEWQTSYGETLARFQEDHGDPPKDSGFTGKKG